MCGTPGRRYKVSNGKTSPVLFSIFSLSRCMAADADRSSFTHIAVRTHHGSWGHAWGSLQRGSTVDVWLTGSRTRAAVLEHKGHHKEIPHSSVARVA